MRKFVKKHREKKFDSLLHLQRENDIISMILDARDNKEIASYIASKYQVKETTAETLISEAMEEIRKRKAYEVNHVVNIHIARYDEIYKRLTEIDAHRLSMEAMKQKEKLLGFHRDHFHMKVNNGEITQYSVINVKNEFDKEKLSPEKKKKLEELLLKAKRK